MSKNLKDSNTIKVVIEGDDLSLDFINEYYNKSEIDDIKNTITDSIDGISTENNKKANISETVNKMDFTFDSKDNKIKLDLKDKNNKSLSSKAIELPFKKTIVSAVYDRTSKSIELTQMSGEKITISIAELITGLATNSDMNTALSKKVDIIEGKSLSKNDFTDALKQKLDGISSKAQVNKIETIKVNDAVMIPDSNKAVNIDISGKANASDVYSKTQSDARYIQDSKYVHTDNNYSDEEKSKVATIDAICNVTDDLLDALSTKEAFGNPIELTDASDCRILKTIISGSHSQVISNGLNLINPTNLKKNMDIDFSTGATISGKDRTIYDDFIEVEESESYYLERPVVNGSIGMRYYDSNKKYLGAVSKGSNKSTIFIPTSDFENTKYIKFIDEANLLLDGYILAKSDKPVKYEPYTAGKIMPTMDNASDISLVNSIKLVTNNRNFLYGSSQNYNSNGIVCNYANGKLDFSGTITSNWSNLTPQKDITLKAGKYIFKRENTNYSICLRLYAKDLTKYYDYILGFGQKSMTVNCMVDCVKYYLFTNANSANTKMSINDLVSLEKEGNTNSLVEAKNQAISLGLKENELFDYDSIIVDNKGNSKAILRTKKIVLDGTNKGFIYAQSVDDKYIYQFTAPNKDHTFESGNTNVAFSNRLKLVSGTASEAAANYSEGLWNEQGDYFYAILPFETLAEANEWLKSNNLVVYYKSSEETVIDLGVISDIPKTYKDNSYILAQSDIDDLNIEIKYAVDLQRNVADLLSKSRKIEDGIKNYFALTPDYGDYTVKFPLWETSQSSAGEKLYDNADKYIKLATDKIREETNYGPAHHTIDCNAYVDSNGIRHITALQNTADYKDTGEVDVYTLWRTRYFKIWVDDGYLYISMTFYPKEGYTVTPLSINRDGSISPYFLIAKYVSGTINGKLYSSKGLTPACWLGSGPYSNTISHNDAINKAHKKGDFYSVGYFPEYTLIALDFMIKFGTKNIQNVIKGNTTNQYQYYATVAEENTNRIIIKKAFADNFDIGTYVSVGDDNNNTNYDRAYWNLHNKAFCVKILSKEVIDDNNTALVLDCEPFTTTKTTLVSSMWERSGYSDTILGRYGSNTSNTNGKHGMVWNGVEIFVGINEVLGTAFMNVLEDGSREIYFSNDASKLTTNLVESLNNYKKSKYQIPNGTDGWKYITKVDFDLKNGMWVPTDFGNSGSGSATGYGDGYLIGNNKDQREFILLGSLQASSYAGVWYLHGNYPLGIGYWLIGGRLSINAVGGELPD